MARTFRAWVVPICVAGLACHSKDEPAPPIVPPPLLYVAPPTADIVAGGRPTTFTALIRGASGTIVWSLQPSGVGALSATTGDVVVYTPPAAVAVPTTVTLTAQGAGMTDAAAITVRPSPPPVVVTPAAACIVAGSGARTFVATLADGPGIIAWSLEPPELGTLSASSGPGVTYTPPASIAAAIAVTLTARAAGAVAGSATITLVPDTVESVPVVSSISPMRAIAGGPGFVMVVDGSDFLPGTSVRWNGVLRPTEYVGPTRIQATIPQGDISLAETVQVTAASPCAFSNAVAFEVGARHVERVNVSSDGTQANDESRLTGLSGNVRPVTSAGGRFVVFVSSATNLVPGDDIWKDEIFLRDTCFGEPQGCSPSTENVSDVGASPDNDQPTITPDGRFVAWYDLGSGSGDGTFTTGIYRRDTCRGAEAGCVPTVDRVSLASDGSPGVAPYPPEPFLFFMSDPTLSSDGRLVAFTSDFILVPETDWGGVHIRDTCRGVQECTPTTTRVGGPPSSFYPSLSADGRFIAFVSAASDLVEGDTNLEADLFVRDTCHGAPAGCTPGTQRASIATDGTESDAGVTAAAIGSSGRFVTFSSPASTLVPGDMNSQVDVFFRDTCLGAPEGCTPSTELVSVASDGSRGDGASGPSQLSADGRFVVFDSGATNLVPNDTNGLSDVFLRDTCRGAPSGCTPSTIRLSIAADGSQAQAPPLWGSARPSISADGLVVVFASGAPNLVPNDTNETVDVFLVATGVEPSLP